MSHHRAWYRSCRNAPGGGYYLSNSPLVQVQGTVFYIRWEGGAVLLSSHLFTSLDIILNGFKSHMHMTNTKDLPCKIPKKMWGFIKM